MDRHKHIAVIVASLFLWIFIAACHHSSHKKNDIQIVSNPEKMDEAVGDNIQGVLEFTTQHNGKTENGLQLQYSSAVNNFYTTNDFESVWSHKEKWDPLADSLYNFIQTSALSGLFRKDYHYKEITSLREKLAKDSSGKKDAILWTDADILLTDGFMHLVSDLKIGRIPVDSVFAKSADSVLTDSFYTASLKRLLNEKQLTVLLNSYEPKNKNYWELKNAIPNFIDSMDVHIYTYVPYPYTPNDENDSISFIKILRQRLSESNCISFSDTLPTSLQLSVAIKKYQQQKKIKKDGQISASLVKLMNDNDVEHFKSIAITLDRYKQMPDSMPERYVWVNLPGFYLEVWDHDTLVFESKVICGKPTTPTPFLTGNITNMITYPTWTVPTSIIAKQYLPKLKVDPNYLNKLGLHIIDKKGDIVNPYTVKWSKYTKGIPYNIVQGSGDDNSLGVMKFNFNNPFSVYLHDTNQRYLFKNNSRALSHGCVRVQEWQKLAFYLVRNDSASLKPGQRALYNVDSITNILIRKEKKMLPVRNRLPLYILYFTCEGKDGRVIFYDDIYHADKKLKDKYFTD